MNYEFWKAALIRAVRTFLQVILAVWTAGQLITEVDWKFLLLSAFSSAVYSLLTSVLAGLSEVGLQQTLYDLDNGVTYDFGMKVGETCKKMYDHLQGIQYGRVEDIHNWNVEVL